MQTWLNLGSIFTYLNNLGYVYYHEITIGVNISNNVDYFQDIFMSYLVSNCLTRNICLARVSIISKYCYHV